MNQSDCFLGERTETLPTKDGHSGIKSDESPIKSHQRRKTKIPSGATSKTEHMCYICGAKEGVDEHVTRFFPGGNKIYNTICVELLLIWLQQRELLLSEKRTFAFSVYHLEGPHQLESIKKENNSVTSFVVMICISGILLENMSLFVTNTSNQRTTRRLWISTNNVHQKSWSAKLLQKYQFVIPHERLLQEKQKICHWWLQESVPDRSIYLLKTIKFNEKKFTIFYDNGCSDFEVKHSAVKSWVRMKLKILRNQYNWEKLVIYAPESTLGSYNVRIPLYNKKKLHYPEFVWER